MLATRSRKPFQTGVFVASSWELLLLLVLRKEVLAQNHHLKTSLPSLLLIVSIS